MSTMATMRTSRKTQAKAPAAPTGLGGGSRGATATPQRSFGWWAFTLGWRLCCCLGQWRGRGACGAALVTGARGARGSVCEM